MDIHAGKRFAQVKSRLLPAQGTHSIDGRCLMAASDALHLPFPFQSRKSQSPGFPVKVS